MCTKVSNFIKNEVFKHHFQSIVDLTDHTVKGHEALFRSQLFKNPEQAFNLAIKRGQLYELDSRSLRKAVYTYFKTGYLEKGKKLFINVYPSTVLNSNFIPLIDTIIDRFPASSQSIILEFVENEKIRDFNEIENAVRELKKHGLGMAIDDFGKGIDDINRTIELDADYIKLDRYFTSSLFASKRKQAYVKFLVQYCAQFKLKLILEGLETARDIDVARSLGIQYAQGFALGKPEPLALIL